MWPPLLIQATLGFTRQASSRCKELAGEETAVLKDLNRAKKAEDRDGSPKSGGVKALTVRIKTAVPPPYSEVGGWWPAEQTSPPLHAHKRIVDRGRLIEPAARGSVASGPCDFARSSAWRTCARWSGRRLKTPAHGTPSKRRLPEEAACVSSRPALDRDTRGFIGRGRNGRRDSDIRTPALRARSGRAATAG